MPTLRLLMFLSTRDLLSVNYVAETQCLNRKVQFRGLSDWPARQACEATKSGVYWGK